MSEVLSFRSASDFRKWLAVNHRKSTGIWLRISKKGSGEASITYAEALDEALCHGWIDGQKQTHDDVSWRQRFTPRRAKGGWSKRNTEHAERLIKAGKMKAAGQAEIDGARKDGRWAAAYDSPSKATVPDDFLAALRKDKKALAFFETLKQSEHVCHRVPAADREEGGDARAEAGDDSGNDAARREVSLRGAGLVASR